MRLPDSVPLGVSGSVLVPRALLETVSSAEQSKAVLLEDAERIAYLRRRLTSQLKKPTTLGSESLADAVLQHHDRAVLVQQFAGKALATLRDGATHSAVLVGVEPCIAVMLVSWSGTFRENQPQRVGSYLDRLVGGAKRLVDLGMPLEGFLEIDAYLSDEPDEDHPGKSLDEVFQVEVEYAYIPGRLVGGKESEEPLLNRSVLLNLSLCSREERASFSDFMSF